MTNEQIIKAFKIIADTREQSPQVLFVLRH